MLARSSWRDCRWRTSRSDGCDGSPWAARDEKPANELADVERHRRVPAGALDPVVLDFERGAALVDRDQSAHRIHLLGSDPRVILDDPASLFQGISRDTAGITACFDGRAGRNADGAALGSRLPASLSRFSAAERHDHAPTLGGSTGGFRPRRSCAHPKTRLRYRAFTRESTYGDAQTQQLKALLESLIRQIS